MRGILDAILAALGATGWPVHLVVAPSTARPPYLLVWVSSARPSSESDATGAAVGTDSMVGITHVAGTADGVLTMQEATRPILGAGVTVPGRLTWLSLADSRPVQVDRDATYPGTSDPLVYGVDVYRVQSTLTDTGGQ